LASDLIYAYASCWGGYVEHLLFRGLRRLTLAVNRILNLWFERRTIFLRAFADPAVLKQKYTAKNRVSAVSCCSRDFNVVRLPLMGPVGW